MMIDLASPMFMAGEVLLGLSITVFIGALIASVADTYRSRQRRNLPSLGAAHRHHGL